MERIEGFGTVMVWRGDGLELLHRTPFQRLPTLQPAKLRAGLALGLRPVENLSYGLDIWDGESRRKVLNVEWGGADKVRLVSFQQGPWIAKVLA